MISRDNLIQALNKGNTDIVFNYIQQANDNEQFKTVAQLFASGLAFNENVFQWLSQDDHALLMMLYLLNNELDLQALQLDLDDADKDNMAQLCQEGAPNLGSVYQTLSELIDKQQPDQMRFNNFSLSSNTIRTLVALAACSTTSQLSTRFFQYLSTINNSYYFIQLMCYNYNEQTLPSIISDNHSLILNDENFEDITLLVNIHQELISVDKPSTATETCVQDLGKVLSLLFSNTITTDEMKAYNNEHILYQSSSFISSNTQILKQYQSLRSKLTTVIEHGQLEQAIAFYLGYCLGQQSNKLSDFRRKLLNKVLTQFSTIEEYAKIIYAFKQDLLPTNYYAKLFLSRNLPSEEAKDSDADTEFPVVQYLNDSINSNSGEEKSVDNHSLNKTINRSGVTPFLLAANHGLSGHISRFQELECNFHTTDNQQNNAIHLAAINGHMDTVISLHQHGVNIFAENSQAHNPLTIAIVRNNFNTAAYLWSKGVPIQHETFPRLSSDVNLLKLIAGIIINQYLPNILMCDDSAKERLARHIAISSRPIREEDKWKRLILRLTFQPLPYNIPDNEIQLLKRFINLLNHLNHKLSDQLLNQVINPERLPRNDRGDLLVPDNSQSTYPSLLDLSDQNLEDDSIPFIKLILNQRGNLQKILLCNNRFTARGINSLLQLIKQHPGIREIVLDNNILDNDAISFIAQVLTQWPQLKHLSISACHLNQSHEDALVAILKKQQLIYLDLSNNQLADTFMSKIKDLIQEDNLLNVPLIKLDNNNITGATNDSLILLSRAQREHAVQLLVVACNNAFNDEEKHLDQNADNIFANINNITQISIKCKSFTSSIIELLAGVIQHHPTLNALDFSGNKTIDKRVLQALIPTLIHQPTIQTLIFYECNLGYDEITEIAKALKNENCSWESLELGCNQIDARTLAVLETGLRTNQRLTYLGLEKNPLASNNRYASSSVRHLAENLMENFETFISTVSASTCLLHVSLIDTDISDEHSRCIISSIEEHQRACFFDVSANIDMTTDDLFTLLKKELETFANTLQNIQQERDQTQRELEFLNVELNSRRGLVKLIENHQKAIRQKGQDMQAASKDYIKAQLPLADEKLRDAQINKDKEKIDVLVESALTEPTFSLDQDSAYLQIQKHKVTQTETQISNKKAAIDNIFKKQELLSTLCGDIKEQMEGLNRLQRRQIMA